MFWVLEKWIHTMTVHDVNIVSTDSLVKITIHRVDDRGNIRKYIFLRSAFIGFDMEGEGTNHAYIVLYMHDRNIRFKIPTESVKREDIFNQLYSILDSK